MGHIFSPLQVIKKFSGWSMKQAIRPYIRLEAKNTWSYNSTPPHYYPFWLLKAPRPWSSLPIERTVTVTFLQTTLKMDTADVSETLVPILQKYKVSHMDNRNLDHRRSSSPLEYLQMSQLYPVHVSPPHVYEDQHRGYILSPALTLKIFAFCPHGISRVLSDSLDNWWPAFLTALIWWPL